MDGIALHQHITEELMEKLLQERFLHVPLMTRIESRIRTRDELERYVKVLLAKLKDMEYRSDTILDRIDRLTELLERLDEQQATNVRTQPVASIHARAAS